MDITKYYLNFESFKLLDKEDKTRIHDYYREMVYAHSDGRKEVTTSLFNTLNNNGFLQNIREEKLKGILDGNNSIDS
jgi:hypothetical protein